jgi:ubiquitin-protein ligase
MSINNEEKIVVVSRETIQRLLSDVKYIYKNPLIDNGIYYTHDDSNIMKGYAMIVGPEDTPYFGGYYFFEFEYPTDYPFSPPKVKYMTNNGVTRFNPNLYKCGKVCVSILNTWSGDKWSACQTINSVLLTLCSLLNEQPLLNEPGQTTTSPDFISYHKSIEFMNINFAICRLLDRSVNSVPEIFMTFYEFMKDHFFKNYDKLMSIVDNNIHINKLYYVRIYEMSTQANYVVLKNLLEKTKSMLS